MNQIFSPILMIILTTNYMYKSGNNLESEAVKFVEANESIILFSYFTQLTLIISGYCMKALFARYALVRYCKV